MSMAMKNWRVMREGNRRESSYTLSNIMPMEDNIILLKILKDFKRLFNYEKILWYSIKTICNLKKVLWYSIKTLCHFKKVFIT